MNSSAISYTNTIPINDNQLVVIINTHASIKLNGTNYPA